MISLRNTTFYYEKSNYILRDFSIDFPGGKISVLLGPNGVGKTTILKLIAGILKPKSGEIKIFGKEPLEMRGRIGYIPQNTGLYPWMRVRENIELPLRILGLEKRARREIVESIAERLGISNLLEKYPRELSGGESQKVLVARILATKNDILLLDEPLSMIDVSTRRELIELFKKLNRDLGSTILMVTHDIEDALSIGDIVYVISGRPCRVLKVFENNTIENRDNLYEEIKTIFLALQRRGV
ncbi:MAG: ATP-binding cassette domain-containing protein [Sulfolobales archaeon]